MSRFNTDLICPDCEDEERRHPDYEKAAAAELAAVRAGNYNFPGIGWVRPEPKVEKSPDAPFQF